MTLEEMDVLFGVPAAIRERERDHENEQTFEGKGSKADGIISEGEKDSEKAETEVHEQV